MKDLVVSGAVLEELKISPDELLIDLAVYLYNTEKMTIGQAKKLAGLSQIEFQKEMARRKVYIKYDLDDLEEDLKTLESLD